MVDTDKTLIMQVQFAAIMPSESERMKQRFGRFYSDEHARVEYPVTVDSHGFDVFRDEFATRPAGLLMVDNAVLIELPYPVEGFVPFSEEDAGVAVASLMCETCGSLTDKHTEEECFK